MHQHAVDLVRLCPYILKKQNRFPGTNFVRRAQRCHQDGKASSVETAVSASLLQRYTSRLCGRNLPTGSRRERMTPAFGINAVGRSKVFRNHRAMKSNEAGLVGEPCKQAGVVAVAD